MHTKILKNAAECAKCGDYLESTHVHDWKACSCGAIFVDGGKEYIRRGGSLSAIVERSEYAD